MHVDGRVHVDEVHLSVSFEGEMVLSHTVVAAGDDTDDKVRDLVLQHEGQGSDSDGDGSEVSVDEIHTEL